MKTVKINSLVNFRQYNTCMRMIITFTYHPLGLSLVFVEEVERFDTQHPGNANDSSNHQNHMNVALEE